MGIVVGSSHILSTAASSSHSCTARYGGSFQQLLAEVTPIATPFQDLTVNPSVQIYFHLVQGQCRSQQPASAQPVEVAFCVEDLDLRDLKILPDSLVEYPAEKSTL